MEPKCIFVDGDTAELEATTAWVREDPFLFPTPVIAMVSELCDISFVLAHRKGADDVILRSNIEGVTRRIANLQAFDARARPPVSRCKVLISHHVDEHRRLLGRVLRLASFDVHFAVDADEIVESMRSDAGPDLVVVSESILPVSRIDEARHAADAVGTRFVVVSPTSSARITVDTELLRVAMMSESAPHDHLLFVTNDLLRGGCRTMRKSPRYLFDTICGFRPEDSFPSEYGLTYNLSETGIYIRTLDPPEKGQAVRLELKPPGSATPVQLVGTTVWVTTACASVRATPPGFGLQLDEGRSPARDLELYREGYRVLARVPNRLAMSWRP